MQMDGSTCSSIRQHCLYPYPRFFDLLRIWSTVGKRSRAPGKSSAETVDYSLLRSYFGHMAPQPLLITNAINAPLSLSRKIPFSPASKYSDSSPPYVLNIVSFTSSFAAANSESSVKFFDKEQLISIRQIPPKSENGPITSITRTAEGQEGLIVTYTNGSIGVFDPRVSENEPQARLRGETRFLLNYNFFLMCAIQRRCQSCSMYKCCCQCKPYVLSKRHGAVSTRGDYTDTVCPAYISRLLSLRKFLQRHSLSGEPGTRVCGCSFR